VFLGAGTAANPLRLFLPINIKGQYAKLVANNRFFGPFIVWSLTNLPQVPFTSFTLSFFGGSNALLMTPRCGRSPGEVDADDRVAPSMTFPRGPGLPLRQSNALRS
jgi:hypothetical protein